MEDSIYTNSRYVKINPESDISDMDKLISCNTFDYVLYARHQLESTFDTPDFKIMYNLYINTLKDDLNEYNNYLTFITRKYRELYNLDLFSICDNDIDDLKLMINFIEFDLVSLLSKYLDTLVHYENLYNISLNKIFNYISDNNIKVKIMRLEKETFQKIVHNKLRFAFIYE